MTNAPKGTKEEFKRRARTWANRYNVTYHVWFDEARGQIIVKEAEMLPDLKRPKTPQDEGEWILLYEVEPDNE